MWLWSSLNLIPMPHILPASANRLDITVLSFMMSLPGPLSQRKRYERLYGTQTRKDNSLFTSSIEPLFSFFTIYQRCGLGLESDSSHKSDDFRLDLTIS